VWKKTDKWRPRSGTGSSPFAVEKDGQLGLAKQRGMEREHLTAVLASKVLVQIPPIEYDNIEGLQGEWAISSVHSSASNDLGIVQRDAADLFKSPPVQDAIKRASGLVAFYAWLAIGDQEKNDHLVLDSNGDGTYNVRGIDFEAAFQWGDADGGQVQPPGVPPAMAPNIDKARVGATVDAIEAMRDDVIREVVDASRLAPQEKTRIADGLIGRRGRVRAQMKERGWLD
jgi:hypothetical protein